MCSFSCLVPIYAHTRIHTSLSLSHSLSHTHKRPLSIYFSFSFFFLFLLMTFYFEACRGLCECVHARFEVVGISLHESNSQNSKTLPHFTLRLSLPPSFFLCLSHTFSPSEEAWWGSKSFTTNTPTCAAWHGANQTC